MWFICTESVWLPSPTDVVSLNEVGLGTGAISGVWPGESALAGPEVEEPMGGDDGSV